MSSVSRNPSAFPRPDAVRVLATVSDRTADQQFPGDAIGGRPAADVADVVARSNLRPAVSLAALHALVSRSGECPGCPALTPRPTVPTTSRPCPVHVVLDHLPVLRRTLTTPARTPQAEALRNNHHRFGDLMLAIAGQSAWRTQEWVVARETLVAAIADDQVLSAAPVIRYALDVCSQACGDRSILATSACAEPIAGAIARARGGAQ